jgi:hypothetical protein
MENSKGIGSADEPALSMPYDKIPYGEKLGTVYFHEIKDGKAAKGV